MPNGQYSGQKVIELVTTKIPATIKAIIPNVPETTSVK